MGNLIIYNILLLVVFSVYFQLSLSIIIHIYAYVINSHTNF